MVWGAGDTEMERAKEVVLDASVAVKWFSKEEDADMAIEIRDEHVAGRLTIVCPDLLLYEVSNALRYNPGFGADDVRSAIKDLVDLDLDLVPPNEEILGNAIERAVKRNITVYDSCYLSLAESLGLEFVTGDKKLYGRIKDLGFVKSLKSFSV
jgi:predicted nucleic acid-binding protein